MNGKTTIALMLLVILFGVSTGHLNISNDNEDQFMNYNIGQSIEIFDDDNMVIYGNLTIKLKITNLAEGNLLYSNCSLEASDRIMLKVDLFFDVEIISIESSEMFSYLIVNEEIISCEMYYYDLNYDSMFILFRETY